MVTVAEVHPYPGLGASEWAGLSCYRHFLGQLDHVLCQSMCACVFPGPTCASPPACLSVK